MRYFKKRLNQAIVWFSIWLGLVSLLSPAYAEGVLSSQANFRSVMVTTPKENQANLALELDLLLSDELKNALSKGMPLFFTLDVELHRPRQWWFDQMIYQGSRTIGIRYNMLLREWRIYQNNKEYREFSLEDALQRITRVNNWGVALEHTLVEKTLYEGRIRLRLDTSLLARPFQITALNNSSAWSFSSSWKNFNFHFSAAEPNA
ncbi:MAG: DUF4390 domain-containing protein [Pelistega sp.]|nr:DUF4390 domain-containing protein [Pelistega sp.]